MADAARKGLASWLADRWAQFWRDVVSKPSIGPVAATLLTALLALIIWLTIVFAPCAVLPRNEALCGGRVISAEWGYRTVAIMTFLTLAAGLEPIIGRWSRLQWLRWGRRAYRRLWAPLRWILHGLGLLLLAGPKALSVAWSFVDYLLARPIAILAGARWSGMGWRGWRRYAQLFAILIPAAALGLVAQKADGPLPPIVGSIAIIIGLVAIVAIVRRWNWIESDRETFLIERGERVVDSPLRIRFKQDLRDEALVALACLFFLAPIALDQVQAITCAAGENACAFRFEDEGGARRDLPAEHWPRFLAWLGYFGAELAKTVPFVDWSETLNVANDSGIEANSPLGAQVAFGLRAGLDLLFLAAVLQAIQIATRLREQDQAFRAARLPILEPFAERDELRRVREEMQGDLDLRPTEQPVIVDFPADEERSRKTRPAGKRRPDAGTVDPPGDQEAPRQAQPAIADKRRAEPDAAREGLAGDQEAPRQPQRAIDDSPPYDKRRLKELVAGTAETKDAAVREAAAALLQRIYVRAPDNEPDIPQFFKDQAQAEPDPDDPPGYRNWLLHVASGLDRDEPARLADDARRARLRRLVAEDWADIRVRTAAARALGRMRLQARDQDALLGRLRARKEALNLRAASAVALAKANVGEAKPLVEQLAQAIPEDERAILAAMSTAYALAWFGASAEEAAKPFSRFSAKMLKDLAKRAALIQRVPMSAEAARQRPGAGETTDQMVLLTPGVGPFPNTFKMGSPEGEADASLPSNERAFPDEMPQRDVTMARAFAIGRFPVTQEEFIYLAAANNWRPSEDFGGENRWPVAWVSWHDAIAYCGWLNAITGEAYRLPSEAEWEYACRAGTSTRYSWGPDWDKEKANSLESHLSHRSDVNAYQPNDWGLWDMHGNVFEWCADPWHASYTDDPPADQRVWLDKGDFSLRVLRGGSWYAVPRYLRSAYRGWINPTYRSLNLGFRLARTVLPR